jgi:PAS domain S-box-containing protein
MIGVLAVCVFAQCVTGLLIVEMIRMQGNRKIRIWISAPFFLMILPCGVEMYRLIVNHPAHLHHSFPTWFSFMLLSCGIAGIVAFLFSIYPGVYKKSRNPLIYLDLDPIANSLSDMIFILDEQSRFCYVNPSFAIRLGIAPNDAIGRTYQELFHEKKDPMDFCVTQCAISDGEEQKKEIYDTRLGGYFSVTVSPYHAADGARIGWLHVFRDVSDRKRLEMEQEKKIVELTQILAHTKTLQGIIPICSACKKIREEKMIWKPIEEYIRDHTDANFSHTLCPECAKRLHPDFFND